MTANWQYQTHPAFTDDLLICRAKASLALIAQKTNPERLALIGDTRPIHGDYFRGLTPANAPYMAGNYRGSGFPFLLEYGVQFGPRRAGASPFVVAMVMATLAEEADRLLQHYEVSVASNPALSPAVKLFRLAELASALFVTFLDIHPYADGNGHMSRMIIHLCFARYGWLAIRLPLHPRPQPPHAPLGNLIEDFRRGDKSPLVRYLLSTI